MFFENNVVSMDPYVAQYSHKHTRHKKRQTREKIEKENKMTASRFQTGR